MNPKMNERIKEGGEIHAGDGGYSISTKEKYDEFVKVRNKSKHRQSYFFEPPYDEKEGVCNHFWETKDKDK